MIVNTARGVVGEDTAALVGGTILNLTALVIGEQAARPASERRPATLIVDEFHAMPGADYEAILSELAKYGANLILATQSLARLEALDREQQRALRATVFANLDGILACHTSEDRAGAGRFRLGRPHPRRSRSGSGAAGAPFARGGAVHRADGPRNQQPRPHPQAPAEAHRAHPRRA